jgi:hypothetical protein
MLVWFGYWSVMLNELGNGAWFIASCFMWGYLAVYLWKRCKLDPKCWRDPTVAAAGALMILITGHIARAGPLWLNLILLSQGNVDLAEWFGPQIWIPLSTVIILAGKSLCIYWFAPRHWRWYLLSGLLFCALTIPMLAYIWL